MRGQLRETHTGRAVDEFGNALVVDAEPLPDLEVRTLLSVINSLTRDRDLTTMSLESARHDLRAAAAAAGSCEKVRKVIDLSVVGPNGPIPARLYVPARAAPPYPVLVWFHGGGFILGDLESADGTCRAIANRSRAAVLSVDYRLSPEYGLDAGRQDCIAATQWAHLNGADFELDGTRIAVGGDSAGGNLAAVVAQDCAHQGLELALQVLVYPATDLRTDYKDHPCANGFLLTYEVMNWIKSHIRDDLTRNDPWLSPALAENLHGVAPALVITAGCDPLREDGLHYTQRLRAAGVPVESLHYPGQFHGFLTFDLILHGGRDAIARIGSSLARAFAGPSAPPLTVGFDEQLGARQRMLTELHFSHLLIGRFLLEVNHVALRGLESMLRLEPARPGGIDTLLARFRQVVEDVR